MRRWVISLALLANVLASGAVLLVLLYRGGWGNPVALSATVAEILVVFAAVAFVLTLLLVPVLGISFWASDRGTRRLEARLAAAPPEPPHDRPSA
jgi:predicted membrane-bound dolichyl-phosphate-mannose-protein mannosyltransferase